MHFPNLIFIQTDSQDGRLLGCLGQPALRTATPHLDRLVSEGALLEQAYCNFPLCCPSRASLWSGRSPHRIEAWNNSLGILPETPTFVSIMAEAGYRTQVFGRTDHQSGAHSLHARISSWTRAAAIPRPLHSAPRIRPWEGGPPHVKDSLAVRQSCDWLREEASPSDRRPFLLYLGLHMPHHPFAPSPEALARIPVGAVGLPPLDRLDHPLLPLQRLQKGAGSACAPDAMRQRRRAYFATIAEVDTLLGHVLDAIDAQGLRERTFVIFCSDHGEMAGEHRQYLKQTLFESSARVPLIVRGPGIPAGLRIRKPVSLLDLHPTLFELAGLPVPQGAEGCSFATELTGASGAHLGRVFAEYHASTCPTGSFMLRRDDWKLLAFPGYPPLLFNLRDDPDELQDRSAREPETLRRLEAELHGWVDPERISARAMETDCAHFQTWRETARREGVYAERMADIYGRAQGSFTLPWRSEDEDRIEAWLSGSPLPPLPIEKPYS